jgi:hypothetical protein
MDQCGLCRAVCLVQLGGCLTGQILNLLHDLIDLLGLADAADQPDFAAARKLGETIGRTVDVDRHPGFVPGGAVSGQTSLPEGPKISFTPRHDGVAPSPDGKRIILV